MRLRGWRKVSFYGACVALLVWTVFPVYYMKSSRELGRLTTVAVVQAIFLVILADAIFAILFLEIDF